MPSLAGLISVPLISAIFSAFAVSAEIDGAYKVRSVKIEPDVIDPDDVSMLEDLVAAAVNEALIQVQGFHAENAASLTGGLDLGALGLNIPGLPGAGGGAPGGAPGLPGAGGGAPGMPGNRAARRASKK